jgi:hypothetical protein
MKLRFYRCPIRKNDLSIATRNELFHALLEAIRHACAGQRQLDSKRRFIDT